MAYDLELAERVRDCLAHLEDVTEKKMFGGLAFLVGGSMAVAAGSDGQLMVRLPKDETAAALEGEGVSEVVMRGRPMRGWVDVDAGVLDEPALDAWVRRGADAARLAAS
jgi:TfoX/Sxy family transcriptional regulator of competence genes